jgi:hypothetical protein
LKHGSAKHLKLRRAINLRRREFPDKVVAGECRLAKAEARIRVSDELAANLQDKIEVREQNSAIKAEAQIH